MSHHLSNVSSKRWSYYKTIGKTAYNKTNNRGNPHNVLSQHRNVTFLLPTTTPSTLRCVSSLLDPLPTRETSTSKCKVFKSQKTNLHTLTTSPNHSLCSTQRSNMPMEINVNISFPSVVHHHYHHRNNSNKHRNNYQYDTIRNQVFVSRHNDLNVSIKDIKTFCQTHGMSEEQDIRTTTSHIIIKECPFCHPTKQQLDNMYKLYVQIGSGAYFCHRCGAKGSWYDFKMKVGGYNIQDASGRSNSTNYGPSAIPTPQRNNHNSSSMSDELIPGASRSRNHKRSSSSSNNDNYASPMPNPKLAALYMTSLYINDNDVSDHTNNNSNSNSNSNSPLDPSRQSALDYLTNVRGLNKKTLRKYGVGRAIYKFRGDATHNHQFVSAECVTFPWIMRASEVQEQEAARGNRYTWDKSQDEEQQRHDRETLESCNETTDSQRQQKKREQEKESILNAIELDPYAMDKKRKIQKQTLGPWVTRRIKARSLENKSWQRLDPPGGGWGLFGWHTIPEDADEIIITEGEYDAMAVYQATGRPCISLPNGCRNLPHEVLPMLERFETIYLWMDNDGPGQEGAEAFAKKLGVGRARLVQPKGNSVYAPKDANEALLKGLDLNSFLKDAKVVPHDRIQNFSDLRQYVLHEVFHPDKYAGVTVPSLPKFTSIVKGFRRGEMTVITGPTGSGKTTFLGQLSLDFSEQGINTLWGSFEVKNTRLMHKLLQQFSRNPIPLGDPNAYEIIESIADKFENLPLYFMSFHGSSDVDDVLDAMDYAVYVHDVEHIILDNLQFMLSRASMTANGNRGYFDKYDMQDGAVEKFRRFATERNVHVTLVVHPRKEDEGSRLGISSIYGTAKSTQEADTVLILQNDGKRKYMEVKKNRFDGTLGVSPLFFQHKSGRYTETPDGQTMQYMKKTTSATKTTAAATATATATTEQETATSSTSKKSKSKVTMDMLEEIDYNDLDNGPHGY